MAVKDSKHLSSLQWKEIKLSPLISQTRVCEMCKMLNRNLCVQQQSNTARQKKLTVTKKAIQFPSSLRQTFSDLKISFFLFGKNTRNTVLALIFTEASTSKSYSDHIHEPQRKNVLLTLFHFLLYIWKLKWAHVTDSQFLPSLQIHLFILNQIIQDAPWQHEDRLTALCSHASFQPTACCLHSIMY